MSTNPNPFGGGATGAAGGVLSGTYPNPGFASNPSFNGNLAVPGGTITASGNISGGQLIASAGAQVAGGFVDITTVGRGFAAAEGANAKQGTAVLAAGTVTVANTSVTANSRILLTTQVPGGTAGFLVVSARVAGTSFTILSSNAADTSTVAYEIFEPG